MSTPFVSGVAALVKSINPDLTNVQIKNIILNNVDVLPSLSGNVSTGGRLDAYKAVHAAAGTVVPPAVTGISPTAGPVPAYPRNDHRYRLEWSDGSILWYHRSNLVHGC